MSNQPPNEPFLSRWSRQKKADRQKPITQAPAKPEAEPEVDPSTLPGIDELTAESDISAFLRKGVPEALKNLALRRMWSLDPEIRNFIEVAENQFDFHAPGGIPGLYQELVEGSDVSVWLAQATQSVVGDVSSTGTLAETAIDTDENEASKPVALQQENSKVASLVHAGASDDDASTRETAAPLAAPVISEAVEKPNLISINVDHGRPPARRRHGGALPS